MLLFLILAYKYFISPQNNFLNKQVIKVFKIMSKIYKLQLLLSKPPRLSLWIIGKTKTKSKTSKKYKLDVVCTAWHAGVNYFKVINGNSVYGEFSTFNISDSKYLTW